MKSDMFQFKQFSIHQEACVMKVNTDAILLGAWVDVAKAQNALDIGSGNGLISLMIAQRTESCQVTGVEIDEETFKESQLNVDESPWKERMQMHCSSIQAFAKESQAQFDLIVSNPPFFSGGTFSYNQKKNVVRHTVKLAHNHLIQSVNQLLSNDGTFSVILPFIEGLRFEQLAERSQMHLIRKCFVRPKEHKSYNRLLLSFSKTPKELKEERLTMYKSEEEYSEEYKLLTTEFYLAH